MFIILHSKKHLWPIVQKFNSLVVIGGRTQSKKSKKTAEEQELHSRVGGYLVPLINQILTGKLKFIKYTA